MKFKFGIVLALVFAVTSQAVENELDFSQFNGKAYKVVKKDLLTKGWEVLPKLENETSFSKQYPEITCGSGSMAVCSVGFRNKRQFVAFIVIDFGGDLIVSEEY
ncbi:hypothetical protein L3X65_17595 [Vibrio diabolicus]|uniref:hypothetical protein n=1 Tax=Vibrio diabolicus TaxID=50719 RepID=UPI00211AC6DD|nr:hypothetical protein [Vibrio diabolicus]MCG9230962.1 hypothetical protein [Vibrio diabolicus]MCG9574512.1 hypothetical protein [Vibrio diabolicus]MCG9593682.1 hypothetical protein [Vibrio diabolicus]MCG9775962.1 hypothetical protein [Vibrio diabolicus]